MEMKNITDFEEICQMNAEIVREKLHNIPKEVLVKACKGTSPENAAWVANLYPEIDFAKESEEIGRIRISEVEEAQECVLSLLKS